MSKDNKILNDLSKVASSTVASIVNIKNDLSTYINHQVKSMLKNMDFVAKNDYVALKKMVATLHQEIKTLKSELTHYKANIKTHSASLLKSTPKLIASAKKKIITNKPNAKKPAVKKAKTSAVITKKTGSGKSK